MFRSIANSRTLWLACAVVLSGGLGLLFADQRKTPAAQPSTVSPTRTTPAKASVPLEARGRPVSRDREAGACCVGEVCTEMTDPFSPTNFAMAMEKNPIPQPISTTVIPLRTYGFNIFSGF